MTGEAAGANNQISTNEEIKEQEQEQEQKMRSLSAAGAAAVDLRLKCINTIRCVSAALPQLAVSGHPGAPMGCAPIAHCLFGRMLKFSPANLKWINRDRFVLSNGHACALQYTMLHLLQCLSVEDLKGFRRAGSRTPGHPECHLTPGVEVSSGPLGQGVAQAVGLAIATELLAQKYNKTDAQLFNNYTYVIVGDGCLQEGITSEASSLAGHLRLGRLLVFYDSNRISIDGDTALSFTEDVATRYAAYGWQVLHVKDADNDFDGIENAIREAQLCLSKPSMIICNTTIGYGSSKAGSEKCHGAALGVDVLKAARVKLGMTLSESTSTDDDPNGWLHIAPDVAQFYADRAEMGNQHYKEWTELFTKHYASKYPAEYQELCNRISGTLPDNWMDLLPKYTPESKAEATRNYSGRALNALVSKIPSIIGGSADLTESNCTSLKGIENFQADNRKGGYLRFGVREHAMAGVSNGLFAFGGFRPFAATFLNFISYAWGAIRLGALSKFGILYIATHDSIELGEDGPTHQPIEVNALLRATPNLIHFRPADGTETSAGYAVWLSHPHTPTVLGLCRSPVPNLKGSSLQAALKGGYVLEDFANDGKKKCLLGGSGSELHLCVSAAVPLRNEYDVRIVSMPSFSLFRQQTAEYQRAVIPVGVPSVYVEAGNILGLECWFSEFVSMNTFGVSGKRDDAQKMFGFTVGNIEVVVKNVMVAAAASASASAATAAKDEK